MAAQEGVAILGVFVADLAFRAGRQPKIGETIVISRPFGRKQQVVVRGIVDRHVPKGDARALYEDVTPPPSPEDGPENGRRSPRPIQGCPRSGLSSRRWRVAATS